MLSKLTGTITPGWAQPGGHGPARADVLFYVTEYEPGQVELTIVRTNDGRRLFVAMSASVAKELARELIAGPTGEGSELRDAVAEMRHAQREYFRTKSYEWLSAAKEREKRVDELLKPKRESQSTLFDE